jgi:hypothetical protein
MIGLALGQHLARHRGVTRRTGELEGDVAVPLQPEPGQAVEDGLDGGRGGARSVGVLDAQQIFAAVMAGIEPVEERGARAADMQEAGRRGGEAGNDGHGEAGIALITCGFRRISAGNKSVVRGRPRLCIKSRNC